jgi:DHA2 family multidrug resistance protein
VGCVLSFVLGTGLFGSVYLMPVFLGFVRGLNALQIGAIMLVTGAAQLATAPLAVALERRMDARRLAGAGFALFAVGLGMSAWQPADAGFREMLWPQLVRGVAIMFCLLPPTRLALGHLEPLRIPDASAVFNLMRNLGGAIGIALIDTVIYGRSPVLAAAIARRLQAGDVETAKAVGLPVAAFLARTPGPVDARTAMLIRPLVERLALTQAINEAWLMLAILTAVALMCLPLSGPVRRPAVPAAG